MGSDRRREKNEDFKKEDVEEERRNDRSEVNTYLGVKPKISWKPVQDVQENRHEPLETNSREQKHTQPEITQASEELNDAKLGEIRDAVEQLVRDMNFEPKFEPRSIEVEIGREGVGLRHDAADVSAASSQGGGGAVLRTAVGEEGKGVGEQVDCAEISEVRGIQSKQSEVTVDREVPPLLEVGELKSRVDVEIGEENIDKVGGCRDFGERHIDRAGKKQQGLYNRGKKDVRYNVGKQVMRRVHVGSKAAQRISAKRASEHDSRFFILEIKSPFIYLLDLGFSRQNAKARVSELRRFVSVRRTVPI